MMKGWNVWLIFVTFILTILGTLLTRSGLVSSVHAFAESDIGTWFVWFLVIVLAVCLFTFLYNRDHLKNENHLESLVSRESSFLFNNLVLPRGLLHGSLGNALPCPLRVRARLEGHDGRALL